MNIQLPKFRRQRPSTKARFNKIRDNHETQTLAGGKYCGLRGPLLSVSIGFAGFILSASIAYEQELSAPDLSTPRKAAQAFDDALERNDMVLAKSIALGNEHQITAAKAQHDLTHAFYRMLIAVEGKFSEGGQKGNGLADEYKARFAKATERISGDKATVGDSLALGGELFVASFTLQKEGKSWRIDLRQAADADDMTGKRRRVEQINGVVNNIEKGHYKTSKEVFEDILPGEAFVPKDQANTKSNADATSWANNYRNAKFITRAEFLKKLGPVHLLVRERSGVSECVRNLDEIVRASASQHGWTIASGPTDIQLVVDADIDRSKITTTEYTDFGSSQQDGYQMAYTALVQVGLVTKTNCRRGDKFVQLDVYPYRTMSWSFGSMGDLVNFDAVYAKAFRQALDTAFDTMAKMSDTDDTDDQVAWTNSLWPPAQDVEMQKKFVSVTQLEPGASNRVFQSVTKFDVEVDLMLDASKEFNARSLQQSWDSELRRNGQEIDPSSDVHVDHEVYIRSPSGGLFARTDACYTDTSAIRVWQKNVVFKFNGELRRAKVCFWSDLESGTALPKDQSNTARDVVNRSIRSATKEFASNR